ncbi:hypothetical protein N403_01685 [Helicobacter pylori FD430]|nr:hypothetical protein N403_01685 [Helicobacter pylori FD430]
MKKLFSLKNPKDLILKEFLETKTSFKVDFLKKKLPLALSLAFGEPFAIDCRNGIF